MSPGPIAKYRFSIAGSKEGLEGYRAKIQVFAPGGAKTAELTFYDLTVESYPPDRTVLEGSHRYVLMHLPMTTLPAAVTLLEAAPTLNVTFEDGRGKLQIGREKVIEGAQGAIHRYQAEIVGGGPPSLRAVLRLFTGGGERIGVVRLFDLGVQSYPPDEKRVIPPAQHESILMHAPVSSLATLLLLLESAKTLDFNYQPDLHKAYFATQDEDSA